MVGGREKETPSTSPILSVSLEQPRTSAVITPKHYVSPEPTHPANFVTGKALPPRVISSAIGPRPRSLSMPDSGGNTRLRSHRGLSFTIQLFGRIIILRIN